ncbi:response regulator [Oleiharenicola sp. Vm1]|uniref:response regulator n=1 Tax=Oleiharenicola sp. Vm1 TaxID=3398393 RepID=UPI0039F5E7A0
MSTSTPAPSLPTPGRPLRILYADDMKELRELISIVLGRDGHTVETFPNGSVALDRVTAAPQAYDLVITDHHMPEMNGLEFVRRLREQSYPGKVMVFSSEISPLVQEKYRQLAVDRILPKPIFPSQLRASLRELYAAPSPAA